MKQLLFLSTVLGMLTLCTLGSCQQINGSGHIVTEKRQTGDFSGISAGGAFELEVKNGPTKDVQVEADDNILKYIETEVKGDILRINTKNGVNFNNAHLKVYVTAPDIKSVKSSGASDIKIIGGLKNPERIDLDVSGAGSISGAVDAPEISAELSGAGNMTINGRTRNYKASVGGSGNLKSGDLQTENTDVHVSGAGNAWVHASVRLKANASGAGNIHYKGGAQVEQHTSGAGNVVSEN